MKHVNHVNGRSHNPSSTQLQSNMSEYTTSSILGIH